jgi:hypothetical protein
MKLQYKAKIKDFKNAQNYGIYFGQKGGTTVPPLPPHVSFYEFI